MAFSFDTNLVIGLVSDPDKWHEKSEDIFEEFRDNRGESFACSGRVLRETERTLKNKINEVIVKLIPIVPKLVDIENKNSPEFQETLLKKFNEIKKENPYISDFVDLVYEETLDYLNKGGKISELSSFWSDISIDLSRSVDKELESRSPNLEVFSIPKGNEGELMDVIGVLSKNEIKFKDSPDGEIFYEVIICSKDLNRIIFISADEEFVEISQSAKSCILDSLDFEESQFSFLYVEDALP